MPNTGKNVEENSKNVDVIVSNSLKLENALNNLRNIIQKLKVRIQKDSESNAFPTGYETLAGRKKMEVTDQLDEPEMNSNSSRILQNIDGDTTKSDTVSISDTNDETGISTTAGKSLDKEYDSSQSDADHFELLNFSSTSSDSDLEASLAMEYKEKDATFPSDIDKQFFNLMPSDYPMEEQRPFNKEDLMQGLLGARDLLCEAIKKHDVFKEKDGEIIDKSWQNEVYIDDDEWEDLMNNQAFLDDPQKYYSNFDSNYNQKKNELKFHASYEEHKLSTQDVINNIVDSEFSSQKGNGTLLKTVRVEISKIMEAPIGTSPLKEQAEKDWNRLSLIERYDTDPRRLLNEFLLDIPPFPENDSEVHNSDWEFIEREPNSLIDKKSYYILSRLEKIKQLITEKNSPSIENIVDSEKVTLYDTPDDVEDSNEKTEWDSCQKEQLDSDEKTKCDSDQSSFDPRTTLKKDQGLSVPLKRPSFGHLRIDVEPETSDNADKKDIDWDTPDDILQIVLKYHPLPKFEKPPYAVDNSEKALSIKKRKINISVMKNKQNMPPNGDNLIDTEECLPDIDSHNVMFFEKVDPFDEDQRKICNTLIKEYRNVAVKVLMLIKMEVKDVTNEIYESRIDSLASLYDELEYFGAKLIKIKNDWDKQVHEISNDLANNAQCTASSSGKYQIGRLQICMDVARILLNFHIEMQLKLEEYEQLLKQDERFYLGI